MTKIKVMSESLANKIAAGEVIEKCASIVKELCENSIDAESTEIKVELTNGGLQGIKITDNGIGMEHDDAEICFERHATSKLKKEDDLFFINTLGFRGEALPSIASVSEVDLTTCATNVGTHLKLKGGQKLVDEPSDARRGTIIEVKNLFYNTPARLKYLKSEQYELSQSVQFIEKLALSYPNIKFSLYNNDKELVKTSGSNNLLKVIHEIYGLQISSNMVEIKGSNDDYDIEGYICKPEVLKSNRNYMITIVNNRIVKNYDLNKAINDAYFRYKPDIKYPVVVIKIYTDPTLIDVNIHPTKQDIKLSKMEELYELITTTISNKLQEVLLIPNALKSEKTLIELPKNMIEDKDIQKDLEDKVVTEIKEDYNLFDTVEESTPVVKEEPKRYQSVMEKIMNPQFRLLNLEVVGQVLGTYIVCHNEDGLFLIDQHAAQERVNYERVIDSFEHKEILTTDMLIPVTIELSPSDFLLIKEHMDVLEDMGFVVEEFGLNTYQVKTHPTWLKEGYEEEIIRNIFDEIIVQGSSFDRVRFNNKVLATIACKMSIRANTPLSIEIMQEIVDELLQCKNPYNCAHGRPSIIKFSTYDLERMFKRVMN